MTSLLHYGIYSAQLATAFSDMGPGFLPRDDGDPLLPDPLPRLVLRLVVGHLVVSTITGHSSLNWS